MLGAIIGDTVGSVYEFDNIKRTDFMPFFAEDSEFTDDSVLSVAVALWLLTDPLRTTDKLTECLIYMAQKYPYPLGGYGGAFVKWAFHPEQLINYRTGLKEGRIAYNSFGNGSAMRASACGWVATSIEEALDLGLRSAIVTHDHPEGIKGAQAVSTAIYMGRHHADKEQISDYIEQQFGYNLQRTCDDIRPTYDFAPSCQETVPQAIVAFMDSTDFESAIRLAVSLGGDSDTLACITGGIAEAFYGEIPLWMTKHMYSILPDEFIPIIEKIQSMPKTSLEMVMH